MPEMQESQVGRGEKMTERKWARKGFIQTAGFREVARVVGAELTGYDYALIGGLAVSYYINPPVTIDTDFLVEAEFEELQKTTITPLERKGWRVGLLRFTSIRKGFPRKGYQLKKGKLIVDLIVTGKDEYLQGVVRNAFLSSVGGQEMKVVRPDDLVVIKSLVGRDKDLDDVAELSRVLGAKLDWGYIDRKIQELE